MVLFKNDAQINMHEKYSDPERALPSSVTLCQYQSQIKLKKLNLERSRYLLPK